MGYRVSLISVKGKPIPQIHEEFGLRPTGETHEYPDPPVSGARLPNGAYLLYIFSDGYIQDVSTLRTLSTDATLFCSEINETSMNSSAACWVDGNEKWSVWHDAAHQGEMHLETTGEIPDEFHPIRSILFARQKELNDCDNIFDIPVELTRILGGFHYAQDSEFEPFEVLDRVKVRHRWWPWI